MRKESIIVVIDGYNVIRRISSLNNIFERSITASREGLLHYCVRWKSGRNDIGQVLVVFDGDSSVGGSEEGFRPGVRSCFTKSGEEADSRIGAFVADGDAARMIVVSDDGEVARKARVEGARVMAVSEFYRPVPSAAMPPPASGDERDLSPGEARDIDEWLTRELGLD
jgi:predicted RNA-binding protein with PIN domain